MPFLNAFGMRMAKCAQRCGGYLADLSAIEDLADRFDDRSMPVIVAGKQNATILFGEIYEPPPIVARRRQRLLAKDMHPSLDRLSGDGCVKNRRRRDIHEIEVLRFSRNQFLRGAIKPNIFEILPRNRQARCAYIGYRDDVDVLPPGIYGRVPSRRYEPISDEAAPN
jgi:hypothetical protein